MGSEGSLLRFSFRPPLDKWKTLVSINQSKRLEREMQKSRIKWLISCIFVLIGELGVQIIIKPLEEKFELRTFSDNDFT